MAEYRILCKPSLDFSAHLNGDRRWGGQRSLEWRRGWSLGLIFQLTVIEDQLKWTGIQVSRVFCDCSKRITADKFMLLRGHRWGHDEVESGLGLEIQRHGQLPHSYSSSKTQFKSQFLETYFPNPPSHIGMIVFSFIPSMLLPELLWLLVFIAQLCSTLLDPMDCSTPASLSFTISQSLLKLIMFIKSVMPSNHLILCGPLLLLPSIFPSIRVFSNELAHRIIWPKYWSFSFSISPSNE